MRIVFLDFDGVLNTRALVESAPTPLVLGGELLAAEAVARVDRLCVRAAAHVVVTSTWRLHLELSALRDMLRAKGLLTANVLDVTPFIPHKRGRGQEIQQWLDASATAGTGERAALSGMVILDDEPDMLHLLPWLVQTSFETGLTESHAEAAERVLSGKPP